MINLANVTKKGVGENLKPQTDRFSSKRASQDTTATLGAKGAKAKGAGKAVSIGQGQQRASREAEEDGGDDEPDNSTNLRALSSAVSRRRSKGYGPRVPVMTDVQGVKYYIFTNGPRYSPENLHALDSHIAPEQLSDPIDMIYDERGIREKIRSLRAAMEQVADGSMLLLSDAVGEIDPINAVLEERLLDCLLNAHYL